jgi:hypothetical protein
MGIKKVEVPPMGDLYDILTAFYCYTCISLKMTPSTKRVITECNVMNLVNISEFNGTNEISDIFLIAYLTALSYGSN